MSTRALLVLALAVPALALAQPPSDPQKAAMAAFKTGPSPTSGSDVGPFPPVRPPPAPVAPPARPAPLPAAPMSDDARILEELIQEQRMARLERSLDRADREYERAAQRLAQQPQPLIKTWPYQ